MLDEQSTSNPVFLAERAYRFLEEQIVTLKLKPGDIVADKSIAEKLGISRTPVREAILRVLSENSIRPRFAS